MSGSLFTHFPIAGTIIQKITNIDWVLLKTRAENNPLEGVIFGAICFVASMGMDILISVLRWGGISAVIFFGYLFFNKNRERNQKDD